ncbi:MAG: acyl-CoA thioesterase [bacterium]
MSLRDLDGLGHVNHAVYLSYLEVARTHYYTARRGARTIDDFDFILGSISCTYHSPAFLHERLVIGLWPTRIGTKSWALQYELREESSGRLVARAETTLVQYDFRAGRSVEISEDWRTILERDRASAVVR